MTRAKIKGEARSTDHLQLNRYLRAGYFSVEGMSSKLSARVASSLLVYQTEHGITGPVVEIGVFRGRFSIALGLALAPKERLIAIDLFDQGSVAGSQFHANLTRWHVPSDQVELWTCNTLELGDDALCTRLGGSIARLIHIDGDHTERALSHDLALAALALAPCGLLIIDDMHHPYYPRLMLPVFDFMHRHEEYRLLAIVDRASVVNATKYILCRREFLSDYARHLEMTFASHCRGNLVELGNYSALLLTARPWFDRFAAAQNAGFRFSYFIERASSASVWRSALERLAKSHD